ncbi:hypothetical protein ACOMHN_013247 [Nucella lapillus]
MWYLERAVEGAFSGELTREQLKIKASIEALIAKKPKDGLISCSTLTTFQNILSPSASSQTDVKSEDVDEGGSTAEKLAEASLETSKETTEKSDHRKQEGNNGKRDNVDSPHKEKERGGLKKNHQNGNDEMTGEDSTEDEQPTKSKGDKETTHKQNDDNKDGSDKRSKIVNESETPSTQDDMNLKGSHHTDHTETKNSEEESDETEPQELNEEENKNKLQEDTPAAESDDTAPDAKHQDEETAKESESMGSDETDVDGALTGEKHAEQSSDDETTTEEKGKDNPTRGSESGTEKEHTSCKSNAEAERMQNANSEPHGNKKVRHEDSGLSEAELLKLEAMFQHKVLEQATKIQSLEILIMRLENHILSQKLNEQNGTNHLVYLENQILRIENELLKLNRSYVDLHAENEMLKSRQNKYLALEHKSKENNTMSLPGNTSEYFQLVLKQQEKITALSELLTNQSSALHKLQSRSDQLEEQNQMLHQIILNQTALISQVVQKLQEVSEQTAKNQQETSHLKSVMNLQSASSNILTKLEHMLNDSPNAGNPSVKTTHSQQSSDQIRYVLKILHQHPDPSSRLPQHNCKNGKHSRVCLYFSLIISSCPPFRTLSWGHCQHLISAIGPIMGAEQNANHGHNVNTQDKPSSTFSKNIHADSKRMDSNPESDPEHPEISKEKGRSQKKEDSDVSSKNDHKQHKAEQKTDKEKEAPDSVDLPDIKLGSKESEINSEAPDEQKAKSSDKGPLPEMRPLTVKAEDVKEPETTNTQTEDNKKPEKDGDKLGGTKENEEKELDASKKTEKQNEKESKDDEKEDIKDKTLKSETNKDEAKTISENKDTLHNKDKFTETQDTVAIVVKMDQQTSGPANPSPSKDSQNQQAGDKTASGKTETRIPSSKIDGSKEGGISEEDRKRKEEAEKALKMKQEAEALQKRIQEAETRRAAYWSPDNKKPKDCYDLYKRAARAGQGPLRNGAYKVFVQGLNLYVSVYCDMKAGGWTVLLKREDGSVDFYRDWEDYRDGFGTPFGEHYVGNEAIHYLTNQDHYSLQVDLKDWAGQTRTAHYRHFWLEDEEKNFQLRVLGYSGTAGDGLAKHDGMAFSTQDRDHDLLAEKKMGGSCARRFMGAGWYYKCYTNNLMGRYYENGVVPEKRFDGIAWKPWKGPSYSLKEVVLKVRSKGVVLGG